VCRNLSRRLIFPGAEDAEEVPCHFHNVDKVTSTAHTTHAHNTPYTHTHTHTLTPQGRQLIKLLTHGDTD